MARGETELQMVQRLVRKGEAHERRRREIVTNMSERGPPTCIAVALLETFQLTLRQQRPNLTQIEAKGDADSA